MPTLPSEKVLVLSRETIIEGDPDDPVFRHMHGHFAGHTQLKTFVRERS